MFNLTALRALKGAPLSIMIAMLMAKQPVGEGWLISVTGYSKNTIRNGCKFLLETQMIRRNGRYDGYVLADGVVQLPLGMEALREGQNLTFPTVTTTTTLNKKENDDSEGEEAVVVPRGSKNDPRDDDSEEEEAVEIPRESKNDSRLVLLYSAGVMEPTASRLLTKAWLTREYLEAHIDKANREKTPVALLIHRLRSHDPKPKKKLSYSEQWRLSWKDYLPKDDDLD